MAIAKELPAHTQIKNHLIENGIKQVWFCKQVDINRTELSRKLKGDVLFTPAEISRISKKLKRKFKLN